MKKIIFITLITLCYMASSYGGDFGKGLLGPKKCKFRPIAHTYEKELHRYLVKAFALKETGGKMDTAMYNAINDEVIKRLAKNFTAYGRYIIKKDAKKTPEIGLSHTKGYDTESAIYITQLKKMIQDFVDQRRQWTPEEVKKFLTKENLQKYADPILKAFTNTTIAKFKSIRPTS